MAQKKKGGKRYFRNRNFAVIPIDFEVNLAALAAGVVKLSALSALAQQHYAISCDLMWTIEDLTAGEVPIVVGLASGDLSATEVKECLEASPTSASDRIPKEQATRPVRRAGVFNAQDPGATHMVLRNGASFRTKLGIVQSDGVDLNVFAHNKSGATLTTGALLSCFGTLYINWK